MLMGVEESRPSIAKGHWGIWHLVSQLYLLARPTVGQRIRTSFWLLEEGFRDAKWWLGFAKARIAQIKAVVVHVCLVCDGFTGHDESLAESSYLPQRAKGKGLAPVGWGCQASWPL